MENIIQPNDSFDFSFISLAHPTGIQGSAYFTKILNNGKPLYIQTPKSLTKQGFIKNGKKIYTDLMFDNNDATFIHWLENLETKCQELIFEKKNSWFENQLDKNDIETAFTSPMRIYKSGKFYLVRANIKVSSATNLPNVKIYNENETPLTIDDVNNETNIISILEIQGIKFTSRNFQIDIELKQSMILNSDALFESCLIKTNKRDNLVKGGLKSLNDDEEKDEILIKMKTNTVSETPIEFLEELSNEILNEEKNSKLDANILEKNDNLHDNNLDLDLDLDLENLDVENLDDDNLTQNYEDEEDNDNNGEYYNPPLTFGSEIKPNAVVVNSVKFKQPNLNELEEIDFNIAEDTEDNEDLENNDTDELKEVDILSNLETNVKSSEPIKLKKPNQVYYEIYKQARKKAKDAKKEAIMAFLEAKNIKKTYMLNDLDESDSDSDLDNIEELI